jgi:hypothetical protein
MKVSAGVFIIIAILVIVTISTLMSGCSNYLPYSKDTLFSSQYPYEGFRGLKAHGYSTYPCNSSIDSQKNREIVQAPLTGCNSCQKVWGFGELFCSPTKIDTSIDIYSQAKGSSDCKNRSSGLSNSKGPLCLDDNQTKMLSTRGGNITGADSTIGKI